MKELFDLESLLIQTSNPVQHAFMAYLVQLDIRDTVKGIRVDNTKSYQVPETLKVSRNF